MRLLFILFIFVIVRSSSAQVNFEVDTLYYSHRISGEIDTLDVANNTIEATTFDGGFSVFSFSSMNTNQILNSLAENSFQYTNDFRKMKYSSLPHLGFTYSFGSQGFQELNASFENAFSRKLLLNIYYNRASAIGQIRNSEFKNNDVQAQLTRNAKRYSFKLQGMYRSSVVNHSGGITTDTLIEDFGLEFTPVQKVNARDSIKLAKVAFKNYFNFTNDSLNQFGLVTDHYFTIRNRVYNESDTLFGLYDNVFIDSFSTRDQLNLGRISNGGGLYGSFLNGELYSDVRLNYNYWDYQNLGSHLRNNEVNIASNFTYRKRSFFITNDFYYNFQGAYNEWSNRVYASYRTRKLNLFGSINVLNLAPNPTKRIYFSNNYNFQLSSIDKEFTNRSEIGAVYSVIDSVWKISGAFNLGSLKDVYTFNGTTYQNDSLSRIDVYSLNFKSELRLKWLRINNSLRIVNSKTSYVPQFQSYNRVYFNSRVFKAKKLLISTGVDFNFTSEFNLRSYNPVMDVYSWNNLTQSVPQLMNLHAFLSFGIDEFRFFFRFENIGYFWNDKTIYVMENFPLASPRFRVGISWDFFN